MIPPNLIQSFELGPRQKLQSAGHIVHSLVISFAYVSNN